jgi:hypothetical protein
MNPRLTLKKRPGLNTDHTAMLLTAARLTLKKPMVPTVESEALKALRAENARLREQVAAQVKRAQAEDRVVSAPGFHEVDGLAAWRQKMGLRPHVTKVAITGTTVRLVDTLRA